MQIQQDLTEPLPPMRGSDDYVDPINTDGRVSPLLLQEKLNSLLHMSQERALEPLVPGKLEPASVVIDVYAVD